MTKKNFLQEQLVIMSLFTAEVKTGMKIPQNTTDNIKEKLKQICHLK